MLNVQCDRLRQSAYLPGANCAVCVRPDWDVLGSAAGTEAGRCANARTTFWSRFTVRVRELRKKMAGGKGA